MSALASSAGSPVLKPESLERGYGNATLTKASHQKWVMFPENILCLFLPQAIVIVVTVAFVQVCQIAF